MIASELGAGRPAESGRLTSGLTVVGIAGPQQRQIGRRRVGASEGEAIGVARNGGRGDGGGAAGYLVSGGCCISDGDGCARPRLGDG